MLSANHLLVLQHIHRQPEITRSDLGDLTQLSAATIARLVGDLRERNFLTEERLSDTYAGRGRPSIALSINPEIGYVGGVEFGYEHLTLCIVDAVGDIVHTASQQGPPFEPTDSVMDALVDVIVQMTEAAGIPWPKVRAVGVALHAVASARGEWLPWTNEPYPAQTYLAQHFKRLVYVEDISRAFAEAEHRFGAGVGSPDMIYVFIGSRGIGAGIFVNNTLLKSSSGVCGEIGHIIVAKEGALCVCGNRGCLETVATHNAVIERLRTRLEQGVISTLTNDADLSFARVCEAARAGDKTAHIALDELAQYLAEALSGTVNIVGSTLVLVGGQLRLAGDSFLADLRRTLHQQLLPALAQRLEIRYAALPLYAGAWGVAAQVLDAAWDNGSFVLADD
jgi:predicted NBD/HSP70 family sugar kinase